jgi:hypothetical protein
LSIAAMVAVRVTGADCERASCAADAGREHGASSAMPQARPMIRVITQELRTDGARHRNYAETAAAERAGTAYFRCLAPSVRSSYASGDQPCRAFCVGTRRRVILRCVTTRLVSLIIVLSMCGAFGLAGCAAAHGGASIGSSEKPPEMSGTISGVVRAAVSNAPLSARRVTAVDVSSGAKFEASTATNGGYTMKVPMGRYRMEVELRADETTSESPGEVVLNRSDLDAGRDFVIVTKL